MGFAPILALAALCEWAIKLQLTKLTPAGEGVVSVGRAGHTTWTSTHLHYTVAALRQVCVR